SLLTNLKHNGINHAAMERKEKGQIDPLRKSQ
ncbi:hypothetical protein CCACVL1_29798, partial [Corchorus capsularis]